MNHELSIYKFQLPHVSQKFEETKFKAIQTDLKQLFQYRDLFLGEHKTQNDYFEFYVLSGKKCRIEIAYKKQDKGDRYSPQFQLNLFTKSMQSKDIVLLEKEIMNIFKTIDISDYIFDGVHNIRYETDDVFSQIMTPRKLQNLFTQNNLKSLETFLKLSDRYSLEQELGKNKTLKQGLLHMIYICFLFQTQKQKIQQNKSDISTLEQKEVNNMYNHGQILLLATRIENIEHINNTLAHQYRGLLDTFFELLGGKEKKKSS